MKTPINNVAGGFDLNKDRAGFEKCYARFAPGLYRYLFSMLRSREAAEDVFQESFAAFWHKADFSKNEKSVKVYLYNMARNKTINYLRDAKRRCAKLKLHEQAMPVLKVAEVFQDEGELLHLLGLEIGNLPEEQKEVLLLHLFEEFDFAEIAEMTGQNYKTVFSRFQYALEKLRAKIKEKGFEI